MVRLPRIIPVLLLSNRQFVKTVRFGKRTYVGDPMNTLRIFNDKEADELIVLDIDASAGGNSPDFDYIAEIAAECFMPITYGGGISCIDHARRLFGCGVDKVCLNTAAADNSSLITHIADSFGAQAVTVSVDVKKGVLGRPSIRTNGGRNRKSVSVVDYIKKCERCGCGEIVINSIDRDGSFRGYDIELVRLAVEAASVPIVACGGAGEYSHLRDVIINGGAAAAAAGSIFVFKGPHRAVLINYPEREDLEQMFDERPLAA